MENLTELKARKWLINQGYKNNEIIFNEGDTPDYVCADGKRYEVKFLYGNEILFYSTQIEKMKDDYEVLIFDRYKFIIKFKWKNRKKSYIKIKIVDTSKREKQITIYPNKELKDRIKKEAEKQHRYMNNLILIILDEYFKNQSKK